MDILSPLVPIPATGYVRAFEAEIDNYSDEELLVRGHLKDHRYSIEHTWILRTPGYEVAKAEARHICGEAELLSPELLARYPAIKGVRIGRGFSKHIREVLGELPGNLEHLFLSIEMARVGQQVYKFPQGFEKKFLPTIDTIAPGPSREARLAWEKDRAYMPDLANSCYTYRDRTAELFAQRQVICTFGGSVISPQPGQKRVFWRRKRLTISQRANESQGFQCQNEMQDTIHDIRLEFRISPDGRLRHAQSRGLRLPYAGICEDAQLRTQGLDGKKVTKEYIRLLADQVGGSSGCTHLFDLSVDCLRLFQFV